MPEEKQIIALQKEIKALSGALDTAHLKIESLETMITIAEEEFKVKIKKNPVASPPFLFHYRNATVGVV